MSDLPLFDDLEDPGVPYIGSEDGCSRAEKDLRRAWRIYHAANPAVYEHFGRFVRYAQDRGFRRYSARTIIHLIRWHVQVETQSGDGFKVANAHSRYYALLWEIDHPEDAGFFTTQRRAG